MKVSYNGDDWRFSIPLIVCVSRRMYSYEQFLRTYITKQLEIEVNIQKKWVDDRPDINKFNQFTLKLT